MGADADHPPLGASWDGRGVHFAVWSRHATRVEVCLFSGERGEVETGRVPLDRGAEDVWRGYAAGLGPGQLYGLRVDGPYDPSRRHLFNPAKLLVDPWARAVAGELRPHPALHGHRRGRRQMERDGEDSAPWVPRSVVIDPSFDWQGDRRPEIPWTDTVIYECHVKGLTRRHPEVPAELRGTYLGLAHPAVVEHLRRLGVTAVELLPVQQFITRPQVTARGLVNYWGYEPIAWTAPHNGYATSDRGAQVEEFKAMVKALHRAGLEVLLDVVFNHSGEGDERELTLSLRGLDHASYYRLRPGGRTEDFTGCGNTLDTRGEAGLRLVLDSLRYWVEEMRVDGFRFDLAPALARDGGSFDPGAELFRLVAEDPVLARVKLVAEPWDLGPGGFQPGRFPGGWAEWNASYRDGARRFWRGEAGTAAELATRLAGSSDLFAGRDLGPAASVNFITCHDGFTLRDLVSYERKHNLANGEGGRDGTDHDLSASHGVEGPTGDPRVLARRRRVQRGALATLALSLGTPLLSHGDEVGRTQRGNNNAYCQDGETTWVDWELDDERRSLLRLAREAFALRRRYAALRRGTFLTGLPSREGSPRDVTWLLPDGSELRGPGDWRRASAPVLGMLLAAQREGEPELLLLLHGGEEAVSFRLPPRGARDSGDGGARDSGDGGARDSGSGGGARNSGDGGARDSGDGGARDSGSGGGARDSGDGGWRQVLHTDEGVADCLIREGGVVVGARLDGRSVVLLASTSSGPGGGPVESGGA